MRLQAAAIAAAMLLCAGCSPTLEIGAGYATALANDARPWEGRAPAFIFRASEPVTPRVSCEYLHVSNLLDGPPFNDRAESSLDFAGCLYRLEAL